MKKITPYLLLLPALVLIIVFKIYPIFITVVGSFFARSAVSIKNYVVLFKDPIFWTSLKVTLIFSVIVTPFQIIAAIAMAFLINVRLRGIAIFRTMYYLPVVVSLTVASMLWGVMMNPNSGILNSLLKFVHIPSQPFLTSSNEALLCIVLISSWKGIGYWMMFLLAGLQNISGEIYEAARIDGSNWWNTTFKVTIPLLNKPLTFVIVSDTIANMLLFVPMFILTNGGPKDSTNVLMFEAYKSAFTYVDKGRSYAIVAILLALISVVVGAQLKFLNRDY